MNCFKILCLSVPGTEMPEIRGITANSCSDSNSDPSEYEIV
jgi:hypothetical protein